jgi:hypothetical protein
MTVDELMKQTGCTVVAEEVIAKRSTDAAQIALARLKTKPVPTATPAHWWQCDCCGRYKPQAHFRASRGICSACVRNPGV